MRRLGLVGLVVLALACENEPAPAPRPLCRPRTLDAMRVDVPPTLDGKLEEEAWHKTPNTGALSEATGGKLIVTHTEVRALWDLKALYIGWYAADEDLSSRDLLEARLNGKVFQVRPSTNTDTAKVDTEDTLDNPRDDDEEWTAELVVPWPELGMHSAPSSVGADFLREDQPKGSPPRYQRWNAQCPGEPGLLRLVR